MQASVHLRHFRVILLTAFALTAILVATGLVVLFFPEAVAPFALAIGANMVGGTLLIGVLFYAGYAGLRDDLARTHASFDQSMVSAHRDALTGTLSRSHFLNELKAHLLRANDQPIAFVQVDMDRLKQINDGSGHASGDSALKHLVATIENSLPDAIVGRLGGDEFGIIVPGHDNIQAISQVCRQMLDALSEPISISGRRVSLSATAGFAVAPLHASLTDDLISKADLALYKGKSLGRNAVIAFDQDMHRDERYRRFIERELRSAILMEELDVYYQPILKSDGRSLKAYEALVRWNHPVRGVIAPSDFIPIAEAGELIDKLGEWVLKRVCAEFAALEAPIVTVNASPVQLRRPEFAAHVAEILENAGVPAEGIAIEITENVPLAEQGIEMTNLDSLKRLGVRIAIDDFGSGNASLSYLKRAKFDILKIDRSYVKNVVTNNFDSLMIASVCRIARAANMAVVAEGIENEDQMRVVTSAGVTALQGFYLGRPQPLRTILAQRRAQESSSAA